MRFTNTKLSGLFVIAGAMLLSGSALAQTQSPTTPAPSPGMSSQPTTAQPGSEMQPYGANQPAMNDPSSQQQMSSPQNSSATMSASTGQPLTQVKDAKTTLASASVQDSSGQAIGQVATVHTTKRGTPTTIDVTLQSSSGQSKTVAIKASRLQYDQSSNTLKTDLTASEVQAMPSASGT